MNIKYNVIKLKNSSTEEIKDFVSIEEPIEMSLKYKLNGKLITEHLSITMRTPGHDEDLISGFLFNERIIENFSEIIISFPNGTYTPDAYFWSGELFLAQGLFEDAKISYEEVSEQFPSHIRAADSLYKLGEIYRIESNFEKASIFYNEVISIFPDAGAAQLSKKSLKIITEESNLID